MPLARGAMTRTGIGRAHPTRLKKGSGDSTETSAPPSRGGGRLRLRGPSRSVRTGTTSRRLSPAQWSRESRFGARDRDPASSPASTCRPSSFPEAKSLPFGVPVTAGVVNAAIPIRGNRRAQATSWRTSNLLPPEGISSAFSRGEGRLRSLRPSRPARMGSASRKRWYLRA